MKNCPNCKEEVPKDFDVCWKCNYDFLNKGILEIEEVSPSEDKNRRKINCLRCETKMKFHKKQTLYKYRDPGILASFLGNTTVIDMYVCPSCLKIELFLAE